MSRHLFAVVVLATACSVGVPAQAGVFTDDLSKCLVGKATLKDKADLVTWMFSAFGAHPDVQRYVHMSPAERDGINKAAAGVMQRLLTVECRKEAVAAIRYEGDDAIGSAFEVLGKVASVELMSNPAVAESLGGLAKHADNSAFEALGKEAVQPAQ